MVQLVCQILVSLSFFFSLFSMIHRDIEGQKAVPPKGYTGVVATIIVIAFAVLIHYFAGTFSQILP